MHVNNKRNVQFILRFSTTSGEEKSGKKSLQLIIKDAAPSDSGSYTCEATNPHGTKTKNFQLLVQGTISIFGTFQSLIQSEKSRKISVQKNLVVNLFQLILRCSRVTLWPDCHPRWLPFFGFEVGRRVFTRGALRVPSHSLHCHLQR